MTYFYSKRNPPKSHKLLIEYHFRTTPLAAQDIS